MNLLILTSLKSFGIRKGSDKHICLVDRADITLSCVFSSIKRKTVESGRDQCKPKSYYTLGIRTK